MASTIEEGAALAVPSTPEEAELFLRAATTAQQARRIYLLCSEQEEDWGEVKLKAYRLWGELLGPAETGPPKGSRNAAKNNVSGTHVISDGDRDARRRARLVAAVPQEQFDEYLKTATKPTRAGLLRKHGPAKEQEPKPRKRGGPTLAGKRRNQARIGRTEARRNGRPLGFWEIGWDVSRLVYTLAAWKVEDADLSPDNLDTMMTVEEDLLYLYDWLDDTLALIHSQMGEFGMREQLRKLQAKTVANGCTPEEAEAARRAVIRLRRKMTNKLAAAG